MALPPPPATPRPRASRTIALSVASFALVASLVAAAFALPRLPLGDDDQPAPAATGPLLVYAEFGQTEDRIYAVSPDRPAARELVGSVEHAEGWGINPAPTMAGTLTAFTVLSRDAAPTRESRAELWTLDVASGERIRLASDADLLVAPVFDAAGEQLLYRRSSSTRQELVRVDLDSRERRVVHAEHTQFGIFPVGFDAGGAVLFARLSVTGTDLYRRGAGGAPELLFHASDHIARDWRLSPDAGTIAYLEPHVTAERVVHRARLAPVDGEPRAAMPMAVAGPPREQYGPAWLPGGRALAVGQEPPPGDAAPVVVLPSDGEPRAEVLTAAERGFDVPLGWSPDGLHLAVRHFDGSNSSRPGLPELTVVSRDGRRAPVPADTELIFIGWIGRA